jgi:hypothetical protein
MPVGLWAKPNVRRTVDVVLDLAERQGLVIYDPQGDEVTGLRRDYEFPAGPSD